MIKKTENFLRAVLRSQRSRFRSRRIIAQELDVFRRGYDTVVAQFPDHALSRAQKRMITQYARDVFGDAAHAGSLMTFAAFRGEFVEGWIPWTYYLAVLLPRWNNHPLIGAKTMSRRFVDPDLMPDLAYRVRDCWIDRDYRPVEPDALAGILFRDHQHVFIKADLGASGTDVTKVSRAGFDAAAHAVKGNLAVQAPVTQHGFFDQITPDSVATIRLTTVKQIGARAVCPGCHIRIGINSADIVANVNSVEVGIMDELGTMGEFGKLHDWTRVDQHPQTGFRFGGQLIPGFAKAQELCLRLHDSIPHLTIVGWDIAIDQSGAPRLIEMNTSGPGFDGCQILVGPRFAGLGWEDVWKN
ncbi:MAG: sugar-transfer associated ATP-grasp domain-containing protein [Paracoccaceae bacterium]